MKYAVIEKQSRLTPGDERSRTNPGHGYPEHTEYWHSLTEFDSQDSLKRWIRANANKKDYRVIEFQELEVKMELQVELKRPTASRVVGGGSGG